MKYTEARSGAEAYEKYMKTVGKWFSEEQKLFAKNKALVDKAVAKANFDHLTKGSTLLDEISQLELELKKTILKHGNLINSTMELQNISDSTLVPAPLALGIRTSGLLFFADHAI